MIRTVPLPLVADYIFPLLVAYALLVVLLVPWPGAQEGALWRTLGRTTLRVGRVAGWLAGLVAAAAVLAAVATKL